MKKKLLLAALLLCCSVSGSPAQNPPQSFQQFRQGLLNDFADFKSRILEHYSDFLNGEWHEYEPLKPEVRDAVPKPKKQPEAVPSANKKDPVPSRPQPVKQTPVTPPAKHIPSPDADDFTFYGIPMSVPVVEFDIKQRLLTTRDYAAQWQTLARQNVARDLVPALKKLAGQTGLNDYLTYRLANDYVSAKFPDVHESAKVSLVHYILANMGYNARIALTDNDIPLLLLATKQTLYAKPGMILGNDKYYVFLPDGREDSALNNCSIRTCDLPREATQGEKFDFRLGALNIPVKPHAFDLSHGKLHLTGHINENLIPILYRYPQMPIEDYACSEPQPGLRRELAEQVRAQLAEMPGEQNVEELLAFVQNVFDYATDQEFHGFEKPYFIEETLYYPKNDCEDRAIFYTYLLWNALGKEAQLVSFPGHEAATVRLDNPIEGTGYDWQGKRFYISDPTFIGASSGMVMPAYTNTSPHVDYTYR